MLCLSFPFHGSIRAMYAFKRARSTPHGYVGDPKFENNSDFLEFGFFFLRIIFAVWVFLASLPKHFSVIPFWSMELP